MSLLGLFTLLCYVSISYPSRVVCNLGFGEESHKTIQDPSNENWPSQTYESSPFRAPELSISSNGQPLSEGYLFFSPGLSQSGPENENPGNLIMTDQGELIWADPNPGYNIKAIDFEGAPALIKWDGDVTLGPNEGHGYGGLTILDQSYEVILHICPQFGLVDPDGGTHDCEADFHEAYVTDRNTILITAYNATPADLTSIGGPREGWVFDGLFFEIEPRSQEVLFRWSALEHLPLHRSEQPLLPGTGTRDRPYDFFHINSVADIGGSFLISARHTWSIYLISASGAVEWTLRGDDGEDFGRLPDGANFVGLSRNRATP